eukprot:TRINITY_DN2988_c0_g3_i1.p1 TRINITY_DN2988_c0_g3~~TRINITY_DN2988_c0_g3_i1.p1  ORF type:complete len:270 (-),score=70.51 TRINITY_DN2988_c0_g3_i1:51-860(-)
MEKKYVASDWPPSKRKATNDTEPKPEKKRKLSENQEKIFENFKDKSQMDKFSPLEINRIVAHVSPYNFEQMDQAYDSDDEDKLSFLEKAKHQHAFIEVRGDSLKINPRGDLVLPNNEMIIQMIDSFVQFKGQGYPEDIVGFNFPGIRICKPIGFKVFQNPIDRIVLAEGYIDPDDYLNLNGETSEKFFPDDKFPHLYKDPKKRISFEIKGKDFLVQFFGRVIMTGKWKDLAKLNNPIPVVSDVGPDFDSESEESKSVSEDVEDADKLNE